MSLLDVFSPEKRSEVMARIKGKNTKPEQLLRKELFRLGLRYRINVKSLPGKPDIVFPKYKTAVFVNGCFWHGHSDCKYFVLPKTRREWWLRKINETKRRDERNIHELESKGWNVIIIWECEIRNNPKGKARQLYQIITGSVNETDS
ncbi:very short patch repair endonuclease [Brevibacillus thermoruber]|uniref:very short patch repair endonuclease n=1 Tax=Brevibacillus thermoruber TaxID=33942 RepID=UPI003B75C2CA